MSTIAVPVNAQRLPSPALRRFAWGVLGYFIAVILWGSLVRATGAGAGCGNHWPLCNGTVMQHSPRIDTMIEFTHRITSGISFFSVVALLAWTFAATVRGHLARAAVVAAVAFTVIEAALGAFLVKLGLTAQSRSPLRAPYLALHLTNTLLLAGRAHARSALSRPSCRFSPRQSSHHRAVCGNCIGGDRARGRRYRIAGRARRHPVPAEFAERCVCAGFLCCQRMAGALALDTSHRRISGQRLPHLAPGARGAALARTGTIAHSPRCCCCCWPQSMHWVCWT